MCSTAHPVPAGDSLVDLYISGQLSPRCLQWAVVPRCAVAMWRHSKINVLAARSLLNEANASKPRRPLLLLLRSLLVALLCSGATALLPGGNARIIAPSGSLPVINVDPYLVSALFEPRLSQESSIAAPKAHETNQLPPPDTVATLPVRSLTAWTMPSCVRL